jgi:hypothetical protein
VVDIKAYYVAVTLESGEQYKVLKCDSMHTHRQSGLYYESSDWRIMGEKKPTEAEALKSARNMRQQLISGLYYITQSRNIRQQAETPAL